MSDKQFKNFCLWTKRHGFTCEDDNDYYLSNFMSPISNSDLQALYLHLYHKELK